ncbi:MAG TPA: histidine kinase, partial [Chitinophagaceae bacterium]|nr:histidine kinase [Chitinophagaceae bacterium]
GAVRINDHELLAYTSASNIFYRVNIGSATIVREYKNLVDQNGDPVSRDLRTICRIDQDRFALTSRFSGVYLLDIKKEIVQRWNHDPLDSRSIGGDNTSGIQYDSSGYLFITTLTSGLHFFNTHQPLANYRSYFKGKNGSLFDGYIQAISGRDSILWLGTQDRLIRWNRLNNQSVFVNYYTSTGKNLHGEETIRALWMDKQDNLWTGTSRYGILVLNKKQETIAHLFTSSENELTALPSNWINSMCPDSKGQLWVATARGIAMIDPVSFRVHDLSQHPVIGKLSRLPCNTIWFDQNGRLWAGTINGAWCYWPEKNTVRLYNTSNGLSHNRVLAFNEDDEGNIFAGTAAGLNIIQKNGGIRIYNRSNGLRNDKCEGILKDEQGYLWIGNLNCILRFDPATHNYAVFEEGFGFSHAGFRMRSCFKSPGGELFWGSDKGLTWFFPDQMNKISTILKPSVNVLQTSDSIFRFTGDAVMQLPYHTSSFNFYFSSGELYGSRRIQFLYKLEGYDKDWKKPTIGGQAGYSKLPPGQYQFKVRASRDGLKWYNADASINLTVSKPWWQQTWFRIVYVAAFIGLAWMFYTYRQKRKRAAEIQQTIDYFANSGYEDSSVDEILWDICRNCISGLGFEDCVIYLLDEERKVLVQKAAFGPKNLRANEIVNPIEIPVGKGIVGDVAQSGKSSIVPDTTKDPRYIVDDERRYSEIAVPLVHDGKVIGVIDSENKQKHFFTPQHLKALQTIASLCSAKISRAIALDAMKKSRIELMELNMKMAESKFLNLRLQMNPHFLFNSLSSIQHLIVSQQTAKAYKYLTVFSNFLRSLLKYAEKNFIPLDEELKIVNMYVELESLRFDQSFRYSIHTDESLANDEVLVPSLMIQPFVENAIWHGLLHKEGEKTLYIEFSNNSDEFLTCVIEDNGIGREKASGIKQNNINSMVHESRGIAIIRERLELLQQKTGKPASVEIEDLQNDKGRAAGTRVIITIPYYNPEEI